MKILKLRLQNINSIRCDKPVEIDFAGGKIGDERIFAITGETGAGKSTLLDAICLALFGGTPRFPGKVTPDDEVLTHGTGYGLAEVEYAIEKQVPGALQEERYTATWEVQRAHKKPDGKLQPSSMEVRRIGSTVALTRNKEEAKKLNVRLLGLDFSNFTRAVLLAQGEFHKFVKGSPNDRATILERITNTEEFSTISVACFRRNEKEQDALEALRDLAGSVLRLTEEQRQDLQIVWSSNKLLADRLRSEGEQLSRVLQLMEQHGNWAAEMERHRNSLDSLAQEDNEKAEEWQLLRQYDLVSPLEPTYRDLEHNHERMTLLQKEIIDIEESLLPELEGRFILAEESLRQGSKALLTAVEDCKELERICSQVRALDEQIGLARAALQVQKDQSRGTKDTLDDLLERMDAAKREEEELSTELSLLRIWLEEHATDSSLPMNLSGLIGQLDQLEIHSQRAQGAATRLSKLERDVTEAEALLGVGANQLEQVKKELGVNGDKVKQVEREFSEVGGGESTQSLDRKLREMTESQKALHAKQIKVQKVSDQARTFAIRTDELSAAVAERVSLIGLIQTEQDKRAPLSDAFLLLTVKVEEGRAFKGLEHYRSTLRDGEHCPCCGALDHPYAVHAPIYDLDETERKLQDCGTKLKACELEISRLEGQLGGQNDRIDELEPKVLVERDQLAAALSDAVEAMGQGPEGSQPDVLPAWCTAMETALEGESGRLARATKIMEGLRERLEPLERQIQELQEQAASITQRLEAQTAKNHTFKNSHEIAVAALKAHRDQLDGAEADRRASLEGLSGVLLPLGIHEKRLVDPAAVKQELQTRANLYQEKIESRNTKTQTAELVKERLVALNRQRGELESDLEGLEAKIKEGEISLRGLLEDRHGKLQDRLVEDVLLEEETKVEEARQKERAAIDRERDIREQVLRLKEDQKRKHDEALAKADSIVRAKESLEGSLSLIDLSPLGSSVESLGQVLGTGVVGVTERRHRIQAIRGDRSRIDQERATLNAFVVTLQDSMDKAPLPEGETRSAEELKAIAENCRTQEDEAARVANEARANIDKDDENVRLGQDLAQRVVAQEAVASRWRRLSDLIGSAKGDKFKNVAQALNLRNLIVLTNGHLANFNDRYVLFADEVLTSMEIQVQDRDLSEKIRSVENMSGGETFQISLALALGLSDMHGGSQGIDTLLIDEGFGSLDDNTRERVMEALKGLKRDGKTVGLISHVHDVREFIPVGIHVKKLPGGVGEVTFVP